MKKILLLIPFVFLSSCIILDSGYYEKDNIGFTVWEGVYGNPYSVSFSSFGDKATFTFIDGRYPSGYVTVTASYMWEANFGGYPAAMYRLDPNPYYLSYYYAFYRSGRILYGNPDGNPTSTFDYLIPEYVADLR